MWSTSEFLAHLEPVDEVYFRMPSSTYFDYALVLEYLSFGAVGRDEWDFRSIENAYFVMNIDDVLRNDYLRLRSCWSERTSIPDDFWEPNSEAMISRWQLDEAAQNMDEILDAFRRGVPVDSIFLYLL